MPRAVCCRCKRRQPAKGHSQCRACADRNAGWVAVRAARRRRLGLCVACGGERESPRYVACGGERESPRYVACDGCRERHRAAVARWAAKPGNAEKNRAKTRRWYYATKALRAARLSEREGSRA